MSVPVIPEPGHLEFYERTKHVFDVIFTKLETFDHILATLINMHKCHERYCEYDQMFQRNIL